MLAGTRFDAIRIVGVTTMMMLATGNRMVAEAATWTEMFIPYNNGNIQPVYSGPYGLDDPKRQHLHLLQTTPQQQQPSSPVFFHAHGNGGDSDLTRDKLDIFVNAGYSIISWESVGLISTPEDVETCWSDFDLVWSWFQANAVQYNFDPEYVVIGGRSRGSICSWPMAHSLKPAIRGYYMNGALPLPDSAWDDENNNNPWVEMVTADSPQAYLAYDPECPKPILQTCEPSPNPNDIHNPRRGQTIVDRYNDLGIAERITLVDGMANDEIGIFDLFPGFAASLVDDDVPTTPPEPTPTQAPAPAHPTATPTPAPPTASPIANPKPICKDNENYRYNDTTKKSCIWIGAVPNRRNNHCKKNKNVQNNCKITCGRCCADDLTRTFKTGKKGSKKERTCTYLSNDTRKFNLCPRKIVNSICAETCGRCCKNTPNFKFVDQTKKERNCNWLLKQKANRRAKYCEHSSVSEGCAGVCMSCTSYIVKASSFFG